ncbi:hypothetical protein CLF_109424 [Clonorchis sinensis]|uniref:Uncharacterized protein n=1 Tax=Clonorchis sinensis TaxID=79923 RepID=G7YSL0_CLOSI|nr:hypothetical protein CLF_109424 [Clonorchis sinensis]
MIPVYVLYVVFLQAIVRTHSKCPSSYNEVSPGLCVVRLRTAYSFCEACEMCAQYGAVRGHLAFILGRNANRVFPNQSETTFTWLGFNKFLTQPRQPAVEWRDVDPRTPDFTTNDWELKLANIEPTPNLPVVVINSVGAMYTCVSNCYGLAIAVYCEYGGVLPTGSLHQQYRSDFPVPLTELVSSETGGYGCSKEVKSNSIIDCARNLPVTQLILRPNILLAQASTEAIREHCKQIARSRGLFERSYGRANSLNTLSESKCENETCQSKCNHQANKLQAEKYPSIRLSVKFAFNDSLNNCTDEPQMSKPVQPLNGCSWLL